MNGWIHVAIGALWVSAVFQTAFILVYGAGPWRYDFIGQALFFKSASLAVVLDVTLLNYYVTYDWQHQVSACLMCTVALAIVYQFAALMVQRHLSRTR